MSFIHLHLHVMPVHYGAHTQSHTRQFRVNGPPNSMFLDSEKKPDETHVDIRENRWTFKDQPQDAGVNSVGASQLQGLHHSLIS